MTNFPEIVSLPTKSIVSPFPVVIRDSAPAIPDHRAWLCSDFDCRVHGLSLTLGCMSIELGEAQSLVILYWMALKSCSRCYVDSSMVQGNSLKLKFINSKVKLPTNFCLLV